MAKLFPEKMNTNLSPEKVMNTLLYFHSQIKFNHWQAKSEGSYAAHKALDKLYDSMNDLMDKIVEVMLGYSAPARFSKAPSITVKMIPHKQVVDDLYTFSHQLCEFAEENEWIDIENLSAEICQVANNTKYLLSLQ